MKKAGFIFCLFFLVSTAVQAQSKMLLYSPDCMQQFEYQINQESNGSFYVGAQQYFMIATEKNEKFYFQIAQKPQQSIAEVPPTALQCNEIALDELLVRQINGRTMALSLLIPDGKVINSYPVVEATYMSDTDSKITFVSSEMEFDFLKTETNTKKDISRKGTNTQVKYESSNTAVCPPQYTFSVKSRKNKERRHQLITLTDDVGVFKYNYARRKKELGYNGEELVSVDGFNMDRYLDAVCNGYLDILKKEKLDKIQKEADRMRIEESKAKQIFEDTLTSTTSTYTNTDPSATPDQTTYTRTIINPDGTEEIVTYTTTQPAGTETTKTNTQPAGGGIESSEIVYYNPDPSQQTVPAQAGGTVTTAQPNTTVVSGGQAPANVNTSGRVVTGSTPNSTVVTGTGTTTSTTTNSTVGTTTTTGTTVETTTGTEYTTRVNPNNKNPQIIPAPDDECGNIYKDLDKGLYFDATTGALANTSCGGVAYRNGVKAIGTTRPATTTQNVEVTRYTYDPNNNVPRVNEKPIDYSSTYGEPSVTTGTTTTSTPVYTSSSDCPSSSDNKHHVVQAGETLYRIASYYNISVSDLKNLNGIKGNTIKKCQRLVYNKYGDGQPQSYGTLTSSSESYGGNVHRVRKGETLYRIAKTYGMEVGTLMAINNLSSYDISVGQNLMITESNAKGIGTSYQSIKASNTSKIHVVKSGETLYRIAQMYGTSIDRIKDKNGMTSNTIAKGQTLLIE